MASKEEVLEAINTYCILWCQLIHLAEPREHCTWITCPLHPYRLGEDPEEATGCQNLASDTPETEK